MADHLAGALFGLRRHPEPLEAVEVYRRLATANPAAYEPYLVAQHPVGPPRRRRPPN